MDNYKIIIEKLTENINKIEKFETAIDEKNKIVLESIANSKIAINTQIEELDILNQIFVNFNQNFISLTNNIIDNINKDLYKDIDNVIATNLSPLEEALTKQNKYLDSINYNFSTERINQIIGRFSFISENINNYKNVFDNVDRKWTIELKENLEELNKELNKTKDLINVLDRNNTKDILTFDFSKLERLFEVLDDLKQSDERIMLNIKKMQNEQEDRDKIIIEKLDRIAKMIGG